MRSKMDELKAIQKEVGLDFYDAKKWVLIRRVAALFDDGDEDSCPIEIIHAMFDDGLDYEDIYRLFAALKD